MERSRVVSRRSVFLGFAGLAAAGVACSIPTAAPTAAPAQSAATTASTSSPAAAKPTAQAVAKPSPQPTAAPKPVQVVKWRVGVPSAPQFDNAYRTIGIKQGFYKDAGIDVEYIRASIPIQLKALLAGELESLDGPIDGVLAADEQGATLRILGSVNPMLPFAAYAKKDINTIADLRGRTVGMDNPGSLLHTVTRALLSQAQVPEDQVTFASFGSSGPVLVGGLKVGKIDFFVNAIDYIPAVEADPNLHVIGLVKDILPGLVRTAITVQQKTTQQPEVAERFLTAVLRSARYANDHKQETVAEATEITQLPSDQLSDLYDFYKKNSMWSLNLELTSTQVDFMQDLNIILGNQQQRLPIGSVLDLSFQKKVIAKLGEYKG